MSEMNKRDTWRWIINLIVSVLTALAASLGTSSCIQQVAPTYPIYSEKAEMSREKSDQQNIRIVINDTEPTADEQIEE